MIACRTCGVEFVPNVGRGRPSAYCSNACRQKAYRESVKLPREMTAQDRWVRWALVHRGDRATKMPLRLSGRLASSTDSRSWASYAAAKASTVGRGLGFMLGGGIGCIDLDHCIVDGQIETWAREIIDASPSTFMERSQSGNGVHIFGVLPEAPGRRRGNVEVYSRARFIAMTGDRLYGSPASLADISMVHSMLV